MPEEIGFIGLGAMGGPMVAQLLRAKYSLHVFDLNEHALSAAVAIGADAEPDCAAVGKSSDIVFLSLPRSADVERAVLGTRGCIEGMKVGTVLVDLSSSRPQSSRGLAEALSGKGIGFLDAPVSRGVPAARSGTLSMMVGGDPVHFDRCEPILRCLASDIYYIGAVGAGHAVKALNNLLSATNLIAALEAALVGKKLGLEPETLIAIVNASSGRSTMTSNRFPKYILPRRFDSHFELSLMYKDIQTAIELATENNIPLAITDWTRQIYALAMSHGMGSSDNQELTVLMERLLGCSLSDEAESAIIGRTLHPAS